ncbi:MAG: ribosome biogenesis GTP-binding protein YihA/YsxC [Chromatiales bacterium]|jgi:GTP-binding protein|nr:ribosome biogenesis GTP-binding protein YihA/YsxC [Chromatiales bacterium]
MSAYSEARYLTSANKAQQFVEDEGREVAFAGRSNAGKSSAINAVTGRRSLARTSKTPGRTQLVNFFALGEELRLVDLPGYGFAKVPEAMRRHWRGLMESYFSSRMTLSGLFVVMDCRRPMTDGDRQMLDWAVAAHCPAHVLLTKADKLSRSKASAVLLATRKDLNGVATVQLFSALKRQGVEEARSVLSEMLGIIAGKKRGPGDR